LAPAILLCLVAAVQVCLTRTAHLTPWKGGGFGMFSTNDDGLTRSIGVRIHGPEGNRLASIPGSLARDAYHAELLPSEGRLSELGRELAAIERAKGADIHKVHIAVWRMDYEPEKLTPHPELVREVIVHLDAPAQRQ